MSEQFTEINEHTSQQKVGNATVYSARVQEAMRYDKLPSENYPLVMTILYAVLQGYTEAQWKEMQQKTLNVLINQPPNTRAPHADATNRYEQTVYCLKDLMLWPW